MKSAIRDTEIVGVWFCERFTPPRFRPPKALDDIQLFTIKDIRLKMYFAEPDGDENLANAIGELL